MADFKYTRRAKNDVDNIIEYIARDNKSAADDFVHQLVGKFFALAKTPHMGCEREDYGAGIRTLPFGNYMIFYRPAKSGVTIVRVLHGARNLPGVFRAGR
ncbi:MAG: type II toxin-antitoxin system RelE/ParE family toxin [Alphaproteobacteria bacterium]|nr:type II toxin-antitoxin system RelE/ParE family toxin [Alphaproteobacteria bacterium]